MNISIIGALMIGGADAMIAASTPQSITFEPDASQGADLDVEQLSLEMSGQSLHAVPVPAAQPQATPQAVNQHATPQFVHQAGNVMYTHQFMPQHPQMQMAMHPQQQQSVPQTQGFPMYATPTFQAAPQTAPQGKATQDQQHGAPSQQMGQMNVAPPTFQQHSGDVALQLQLQNLHLQYKMQMQQLQTSHDNSMRELRADKEHAEQKLAETRAELEMKNEMVQNLQFQLDQRAMSESMHRASYRINSSSSHGFPQSSSFLTSRTPSYSAPEPQPKSSQSDFKITMCRQTPKEIGW